MDKRARTELFLSRLGDAPSCASAQATLEQIEQVMNDVENEFTSIPYNPSSWDSDGRLYPPQEDRRRDIPGHPEVRRYRSVGHNILVADNGAVKIEIVSGGAVCLDKSGSDGLTVDQLMESRASTSSSPTSKA